MLLAQEFDAVENGRPYPSTRRRRLCTPDTRSRVVGYLGTAPVAAPGYRTDGAWVWPESLAEIARERGVAPQEQLYDHMRQSSFLLPTTVSADRLALAAAAVAEPADPTPASEWVHLGGQYVEISGHEAAELNDRICAHAHDAWLIRGRESALEPTALRLARTYDGESPTGTPWFSPSRPRIPEPVRRERIASYLSGGRPVLRGTGRTADPLDDRQSLPLNFRTDGVWVWPEALAHYAHVRGLAPELELLCHIEERGYRLPATVPDDLVPVAAALARAQPGPRLSRPPLIYLGDPSGGLARAWRREPGTEEVLRDDLRWGRPRPAIDRLTRDSIYREIDENEAVRIVDARWAAGDAVPPLD